MPNIRLRQLGGSQAAHSKLGHWASLFCLLSSVLAKSQSCSCYRTDFGDTFQHYGFWDFRNLANSTQPYQTEPANVTTSQLDAFGEPQTGYLSSLDFTTDWIIDVWSRNASRGNPVPMQYSRENVYILTTPGKEKQTHLSLRTFRTPGYSSCAEVVSMISMHRASIRVFARVRGDSGAVAGLFTYYNDTQESDIEILTQEPADKVFYTNQPNVDGRGHTVTQAEVNGTFPQTAKWTDWNEYRIDWLPNVINWYINGTASASNTYGVPQEASNLTLNVWSDGSNWSGNMSVGGAAYMDIQWIEMAYNTTASQTLKTCHTICEVATTSVSAGAAAVTPLLWQSGITVLIACILHMLV